MTTFGWSDGFNYIYLKIKSLAPSFGGQFIPANNDLCYWLLQEMDENPC